MIGQVSELHGLHSPLPGGTETHFQNIDDPCRHSTPVGSQNATFATGRAASRGHSVQKSYPYHFHGQTERDRLYGPDVTFLLPLSPELNQQRIDTSSCAVCLRRVFCTSPFFFTSLLGFPLRVPTTFVCSYYPLRQGPTSFRLYFSPHKLRARLSLFHRTSSPSSRPSLIGPSRPAASKFASRVSNSKTALDSGPSPRSMR